LIKYYNAAVWMDNQEIPVSTREEYLPQFHSRLVRLNQVFKKIKEAGITYTDNDLLNGFVEGD
jgi:hypothetical protein